MSHNLWTWDTFFGLPGSHNHINVQDHLPLFSNLLNRIAPKCEYTINGHHYTLGYFLADRIYTDWSTLVKTISNPQGLDKKVSIQCFQLCTAVKLMKLLLELQHFAKMQEVSQKDVEGAFGLLQARFAIVARPACG